MNFEISLLHVFEKTLSQYYPDIHVRKIKNLLKESLKKRKYDTQDQAIIEAILNDKEKPLEESFTESLLNYASTNKIESENDFPESKERREEIVEIFIFDLEKLIDYFYNALINKHFT